MAASNTSFDLLKKLKKTKSGLKCVQMNDSHQSPLLLNEPYWVPDKEVLKCGECNVKFTLTNRKHHCRRCGHIFCAQCTKSKVWLPRMCFMDPVRVCEPCAIICKNELEFFDHGIRILTTGAMLFLNPLKGFEPPCLSMCKLSQSHKCIQFDKIEYQDIPLESVTDFSVTCDVETGNSWIEFFYGSSGLRLTTDKTNFTQNSLSWIRALEQAFRLISINARSLPKSA